MKIIQALKRIKHLSRKIEGKRAKIAKWCSFIDDGSEQTYDEEDLRRFSQAINDMAGEIVDLRTRIHMTNTKTEIEFENKKRSLDSLLAEATIAIPISLETLSVLRRKEKGRNMYGRLNHDASVQVVLQYDPKKRDNEIERLEERKRIILDIVDDANINTDLV